MMDSSTSLTAQQRDVLIQQVTRRMARLPDERLLQFEALTRHPQISSGGSGAEDRPTQPRQQAHRAVEAVGSQPAQALYFEQPRRPQEKPVSRREALHYGASGFMGLLAFSAGGGWLVNTNRLEDIQSQIINGGDSSFYISLRGTLARLNNQLNLLRERCDTSCAYKEEHNRLVTEYQARVMPTYQSIAALRGVVGEINQLVQTLGEGNLLAQFFAVIAKKNPAAIIDFLWNAGAKAAALWEYFSKIPDLILACEQALGELEGWFSAENNIDVTLLRPLQDDLFHAVDDTRMQASDLQQTWQVEVSQVLPPTLDRWQQIREAAG